DRSAAHLVPRLLKALGPHGLLLLTWDEGRDRHHAGIAGPGTGGGHVPLILAGGLAPHRVRMDAPLDHYAILATVESLFHLRPLGQAGGRWVRPLLRPGLERRN